MKQPAPKYYQIYEELLGRIKDGAYSENDLFPSDTELVQMFNVSRGTVREAIKLLLQQGYLVREQGKGTFVIYKKIEQDPDKLIGFTELMEQHNLKPSARLIEKEIIHAPANISRTMELEKNHKVIRIVRLRFGDNQPLIVERSYFSLPLFMPIYQMNLEQHSIYELLHDHTDTRLGDARQSIEAISAGHQEQQLLEVEAGTPLLLIKRLIRTEEQTIFQYSEDVYRSDRINFSTQTIPYHSEKGVHQLPFELAEKDIFY